MPIMLMRNLDQLNGKANGTILIVQRATSHIIQARIVNGERNRNQTC